MRKYRISDLFTSSRIALVCITAVALCFWPDLFGFWGIPLIILIFITDMFDGWFARKFDRADEAGAFYDITADRITETILLVPFVYLQAASPLFLIYFVAKGFVVDHVRLRKFMSSGKVPFAQGQGAFFKLVKSRFMRALYGILKVVMIVMFYLRLVYPASLPVNLADIVAVVTVGVSLLRTIPALLP